MGTWRKDRIAWIGLGALALVAYGPVLVRLIANWWQDTEYSHGLICVPLAAAIVWSRREELTSIRPVPSRAGLAGATAAIALLLIGTLGAELFLTRVSLLLFISSAVLYLFGWRHLRAVAFPLALVALSIPIPAILMTHVTLPLQFAASSAAETTLAGIGIPVLREGNVLVLPDATLQVAEACSGVRSMMSLLVIGVFIARIMDRHVATRIAIVAAAVPVTIFINAFRVTTTAVLTQFYGVAAAQGLIHEALGIVLFLASAAMLAGCARVLVKMAPRVSVKPS